MSCLGYFRRTWKRPVSVSFGAMLLSRDAIASAVEACMPITSAHRHAMNVQLDRESLWVSADPVRLEQVAVAREVRAAVGEEARA